MFPDIEANSKRQDLLVSDSKYIQTSQGTGPVTPTTPPPPPPGCNAPEYANDEYCDDENNNADCDWDGGACCANNASNWDIFCTDCECLDPNGGTTTPCKDKWKAKKCKKQKKKGKCSKKKVAKKCKKTCGKC